MLPIISSAPAIEQPTDHDHSDTLFLPGKGLFWKDMCLLYLVYYAPARVTSCCLVTQSKLAGLIQRNVVSVTSIYYYSPIIKCRVCTSSDCYEYNKARVTLHLNLIVFHLTDYYMCPIQPV